MKTSVVLFTRDLRLHDHPALTAATRQSDRVVPAFVIDERLVGGRAGAPNRLAFLLESLRDLNRSLRERGSSLVIRSGDVVTEVMRLAGECTADAIFISEDVSGYARARMDRLRLACEDQAPGASRVRGRHRRPARRAHPAERRPLPRLHPVLAGLARGEQARSAARPAKAALTAGLRTGRLPKLSDLTAGFTGEWPAAPAGSRPAASASAAGFETDRGGTWNSPTTCPRTPRRISARICTSAACRRTRLSRASTSGGVSRTSSGSSAGGTSTTRCWRPGPTSPTRTTGSGAAAGRAPRRLLDAWKEGRTGYPIVDAGMRQLAAEGFIPNRARLIVASFLTKTLGIDWRAARCTSSGLLVDGDLANNSGNWQWVAGTGNDTRPNRVLNPIRQAHRFDPDGAYVRRLVPELAGIEGRAIHEPWKLDGEVRAGLDYPEPVVAPPS